MKVLILLSRCDQTGMTTNTLDLCEGLLDLGHEVTLIVGKGEKTDAVALKRLEDFRKLNIKIKRFCLIKNTTTKFLASFQILFSLIFSRTDIIHVESPYLTFLPWLLRKKFTSTFHVNDLYKCFYYKNAPHLIAISKETKEYAMKNFGFLDKDVSIINHGVGKRFSVMPSDYDRMRTKKRYRIPLNKIIIGLVGSIKREKDITSC